MSDGISDGYRAQREYNGSREFIKETIRLLGLKKINKKHKEKLFNLHRASDLFHYNSGDPEKKMLEEFEKLRNKNKIKWIYFLYDLKEYFTWEKEIYEAAKAQSPFAGKIVVIHGRDRFDSGKFHALFDIEKFQNSENLRRIDYFEVGKIQYDKYVCTIWEEKTN
jgi:hypothetical protein